MQARREVGAIAKDIQAAQKQVAALEAKIEQKRGDRHAILKQCKVSETCRVVSFVKSDKVTLKQTSLPTFTPRILD
jgi:hypothetical protein